MKTLLLIYNPESTHHHYRMVNGLNFPNFSLKVSTQIPDGIEKYDFIFIEHSVDLDLSKLKDRFNEHLILFDMEDNPSFFEPGLGFYTSKDFASAYAKYNYQPNKPNPTGLKLIAAPQLDYIVRGSFLANQAIHIVDKIKRTGDVFFYGTPTYLTEYTPKKNAGYVINDDIRSVSELLTQKNHYVYNQRLEWIYRFSKSNLKFKGGLHFEKDPEHCCGIEFQSRQFGDGCRKFKCEFMPHSEYYNEILSHPIGPCPTGIARSSYRIIELMSLGRIILITDMEGYRYLYNPKVYITVPDGDDIVKYAESSLANEKEILESSKENINVFLGLTPEKMFSDFIKQIDI